jgi:hypothetical protein
MEFQKVETDSVIWSLNAAKITIFSNGVLKFLIFFNKFIAEENGIGSFPLAFAS